jgi:hypothetical protein
LDVLEFSRNVSLLSLLGFILRRDPLFSASIGTFRHGLQWGITKKVEEKIIGEYQRRFATALRCLS